MMWISRQRTDRIEELISIFSLSNTRRDERGERAEEESEGGREGERKWGARGSPFRPPLGTNRGGYVPLSGRIVMVKCSFC